MSRTSHAVCLQCLALARQEAGGTPAPPQSPPPALQAPLDQAGLTQSSAGPPRGPLLLLLLDPAHRMSPSDCVAP
eukprot:scaffold278434_cov19-Tisochrysis_lutea.AAC.1